MKLLIIGGKAFSVKGDTLTAIDEGIFEVTKKRMNTRSLQQNSAQYLWLTQIAQLLNTLNMDVETILKHDTSWSMEKCKVMILDPIVLQLYGKTSTTQLKKDEYELIILTMTKAFGAKSITLPPFPSVDEMLFEKQLKELN